MTIQPQQASMLQPKDLGDKSVQELPSSSSPQHQTVALASADPQSAVAEETQGRGEAAERPKRPLGKEICLT